MNLDPKARRGIRRPLCSVIHRCLEKIERNEKTDHKPYLLDEKRWRSAMRDAQRKVDQAWQIFEDMHKEAGEDDEADVYSTSAAYLIRD